MKKIIVIIFLLFLAACGSQTDELSYLKEIISHLETEQYYLIDTINEQTQEIEALQGLIADFEVQHHIQTTIQNEIIDSFMDNLDWIAEFLGVPGLYIAENDIVLHRNFLVTAHGRGDSYWVDLVMQYWVFGDESIEIIWELLRYNIHGVAGSGMWDGGKSAWQWKQYDLFDESFTMRFYNHIDYSLYEYFDEEISPQDWQAQVISHMRVHTGIQISDLWYEGLDGESRLVVNLTPAASIRFNWGSTGGQMLVLTLIDSMSTLPNVMEIEVLVGGQRGVSADHFSFAGVFRVN